MSNLVKILLGVVAVGFVTAVTVTIVKDRKLVGTAERVTNVDLAGKKRTRKRQVSLVS